MRTNIMQIAMLLPNQCPSCHACSRNKASQDRPYVHSSSLGREISISTIHPPISHKVSAYADQSFKLSKAHNPPHVSPIHPQGRKKRERRIYDLPTAPSKNRGQKSCGSIKKPIAAHFPTLSPPSTPCAMQERRKQIGGRR